MILLQVNKSFSFIRMIIRIFQKKVRKKISTQQLQKLLSHIFFRERIEEIE
jgi:hypothetical protein